MRAYHCPNCFQYHLTSQVTQQSMHRKNKLMLTNLAKKWEKTGLLHGLGTDEAKEELSKRFETTAKLLVDDQQLPEELFAQGIIPVIRMAYTK